MNLVIFRQQCTKELYNDKRKKNVAEMTCFVTPSAPRPGTWPPQHLLGHGIDREAAKHFLGPDVYSLHYHYVARAPRQLCPPALHPPKRQQPRNAPPPHIGPPIAASGAEAGGSEWARAFHVGRVGNCCVAWRHEKTSTRLCGAHLLNWLRY
jgi:hypothetical protein